MLKKDEKNKQESTTKKEAKFQMPEEEKEQTLPPFPLKNQKDLSSGFPGGDSEGGEEDFSDLDIEEVCKDIVSVPFEVWSILKPSVKPLTETEKKLIGKPLSRVMVKYDVAKYARDEFLLLIFLGFSVSKRIKDSKKVEVEDEDRGTEKD